MKKRVDVFSSNYSSRTFLESLLPVAVLWWIFCFIEFGFGWLLLIYGVVLVILIASVWVWDS